MPASIRVATSGKVTGTAASVTFTPPPGIQNGDLWVINMLTGNTNGFVVTADLTAKRWWRPDQLAVNTRFYSVLARIYNSADPTSEYTLALNVTTGARWSQAAIMDHAVTQASDILLSSKWIRNSNGGTQGKIVAPSVTTTAANMLVLAFTGEATTATGSYSVNVPNGFTLATEGVESGDIEWTTIFSKVQPAAGAVGPFELTYVVGSLNGIGQQLAVPSSIASVPTTGRIGARVPTSVAHNSITMGLDRIGGDVVEVQIKLGATLGARQTVTIDGTSGWGSTTFTGLEADAYYGFDFYVDGAKQTDTEALIRTHPVPGTPTSFKFIAGSCQFTGSNHPVWDRILEEGARGLGHMGDLTYADTADAGVWRTAVESSLTAPRFRAMLGTLPMTWTWDNHDRIFADDGGAGTVLNLGRTDPATLTNWKQLAGTSGWASSDSGGRTWVIGRVRFIQTDNWTNKTDPDAGTVPTNQQTFLGAAQKQWFKDTLDAATEPIIVWLSQWTTSTTGNGRWNSYNTETAELEAFINARPAVKARMVMIGGDSHSVNVTDGSRTEGNFDGIPSFNISGFNRSSETGHGGTGWTFDAPLRTAGQAEADWGGYSRLSFTDSGSELSLLWEAVRVNAAGVTDVMTSQTITKTGLDPAWDVLDVSALTVGTKITAANTDNFFDNGYPAGADRLTVAQVTDGPLGVRMFAGGSASASKLLPVGHREKGRIGWKMEFFSNTAATSYAEMVVLRTGNAAEFLIDVGLRHNTTTLKRYPASRNAFNYIGQANAGNAYDLDAGEKWAFELYWDGTAGTVYVWPGSDTSGSPLFTWTGTMTALPINFLFSNDATDGVDAILYDVWVSDGARRMVSEPEPGTLSWIGNWDSRSDRAQVVGKVSGASLITLTMNATDINVVPDADGYFRINAPNLLPGVTYNYDLKVDGVSRQVGSFKNLPSPTAASHKVILGSCYDSYTSAVFMNMALRQPDLVLNGGDRGYSWLSSSINGPIAPADVAGVRAIREQVYAAVDNRKYIDYSTPLQYIYSDTDGAGANSDGSFQGFVSGAVQTNYRQQVANIDLPLTNSAGRSFVVGNIRYIITDETTMASPKGDSDISGKSKLGTEQLAWFLNQLTEAAQAKQGVLWFGDGPFHAPTVSSGTSNEWSRYNAERLVIQAHIQSSGVKIVRANGDRHALAADNGTNNPFGGFPTVNAAPFHTTANPYGMAASAGSHPTTQTPGSRHYTVLDASYNEATGETLLRFRGYSSTNSEPTEVERYDMTVDLSYPVPTITAAVSGSGSVTALVEPVVAVEALPTGSGTVSAVTDIVLSSEALPTGSGAVSAVVQPVVDVQALPTGSGALTAALSVQQDIEALPSGSGSLSMIVSAEQTVTLDAALSGSGSLTATTGTDLSAEIAAQLTSSGTVSMTVSSELLVAIDAPLSGSGTATAATSAEMAVEIDAIFSGFGITTAAVSTEGAAETEAALSGSGELSMDIAIEQFLAVPLSGSGEITATTQSEDAASATVLLSGSGSLTLEIEIFTTVLANFSGSGSLTTEQSIEHEIEALFSGAGTATAVAWVPGDDIEEIYLNGKRVFVASMGRPVSIAK